MNVITVFVHADVRDGVTVCDSVRSTLLGLQMSLDILNARSQAELQDTQILSEVKFSHLNSTM